MKALMSTFLSANLALLLIVYPVKGQNAAAQNGDSLRVKIEQLEKTDIQSKSPTVQDIYKRSLLRLYDQYVAALEQDINDLERIQSATSDTVNNAENEAAALIRKLTGERNITNEKIATLRSDLRLAASSNGTASTSSRTGRSTQVLPAVYVERDQASTDQHPNTATDSPTARPREVLAAAVPRTDTVRAGFQTPAQDDDSTETTSSGTNTTPATTPTPASTPDANAMEIDWPTRTAGCPPSITQSSTRTQVHVTGVNDLLIDFDSGARLEYQLQAKGTHVSAVPENPFELGAAAPGGFRLANCELNGRPFNRNALRALLARIRSLVQSNPNISPAQPGGRSIPLATTLAAALNIPEVNQVLSLLSNDACDTLFGEPEFANHPVMNWIRRINGDHTYDFNIVLEPNQNYEFTLREYWKGVETRGGTVRRHCGENDIFSLSLGPLVSTLPQRTYTHQKALVPAGSATTQDVLTVGNNRNISVLGAALLNYHFPRVGWLPNWAGLTLSAGPVYTLGGAPEVSALGLFVGTSFQLSRSVFLTPGVHIGQFADFPEGFAPGTIIPDQFGDLNPVKRTTARFAFGITYRTNSFKKSAETSGSASNSGTATAGGSTP